MSASYVFQKLWRAVAGACCGRRLAHPVVEVLLQALAHLFGVVRRPVHDALDLLGQDALETVLAGRADLALDRAQHALRAAEGQESDAAHETEGLDRLAPDLRRDVDRRQAGEAQLVQLVAQLSPRGDYLLVSLLR
jgi:hypothetical protein